MMTIKILTVWEYYSSPFGVPDFQRLLCVFVCVMVRVDESEYVFQCVCAPRSSF